MDIERFRKKLWEELDKIYQEKIKPLFEEIDNLTKINKSLNKKLEEQKAQNIKLQSKLQTAKRSATLWKNRCSNISGGTTFDENDAKRYRQLAQKLKDDCNRKDKIIAQQLREIELLKSQQGRVTLNVK